MARTRLPPTNATYKTQRTDLGLIGAGPTGRTAHAAARRFGPQRRVRPLREFHSSSAKAFALELHAMNTAMDDSS